MGSGKNGVRNYFLFLGRVGKGILAQASHGTFVLINEIY